MGQRRTITWQNVERKDGRWEGRYPKGKKDGKYITGSVFGKTYYETKEKLIQAKATLSEKLKSDKEQHNEILEYGFAESAEEWLDSVKPTLKKYSISKYRNVLDKHLLPEFGERNVVDITRYDVTSLSSKMLTFGGKDGKGLAPKTAADIISVMKNVMDYVRHVKCIYVIDFDVLRVKQPQKQLRVFSILVDMRRPDSYFFLTGQEKVYMEPRVMDNHFDRVMESCGIIDATMHTCRHSFATRCVELGFDINTLSEILGHANVSITMNRYVHPSMEQKQKNMNKLSGLLLGVKNGVSEGNKTA